MNKSAHDAGSDAAHVPARNAGKDGQDELVRESHQKPLFDPSAGAIVRYFGDYELLEEIGRGGMGVVYRARQTRLNRIVALKMILAGQLASKSDVQRFQSEAEAAARLDHPGIVPIFEVGEHEGHHFYSMALVDGESLAHRIAETPLGPERAAELVRKVAVAVHHAHQKKVIHRDLKPGNILVDHEGQPRVTDFGLARQLAGCDPLTVTGHILGTPSFMSPEQAGGQNGQVSQRTDVYSLGAVLYAALCGCPPHQADNPLDTLRLVVDSEPVPPRQLNAGLPRDLETICLKCLRKSPAQRYATAADLAEDLERYQQAKPILARPAGQLEITTRWCRRNPVIASLLALSVMLLLGGTAVASYLAVLAIGQREHAQDELYRNRIMLAERELESGQSYSAQQILAETPTDRRGWEWQYLLRLSLISPSQSLLSDSKPIAGAQFSNTGDRLVSITQDGMLDILDGLTLQPLYDSTVADSEVVDLKLNADGTKAFIGTKSQQLYVNVEDGKVEWKTAPFSVSAVSGDGSLAIVTTSSDKKFKVDAFKAGTDQVLWSTEGEWESAFKRVEFDETDRKLRILNSQRAFVFDAVTGEQLAEMSLADYSRLQDPSPENWYLAATGDRWNKSVMCLSKSSFNTRIYVANMDRPSENIELPLGPGDIYHPVLSSDGTMLAYAVKAQDHWDDVPQELMESTSSLQEFHKLQIERNIPGGGGSSYLIHLYETRTGSLLHVLRGFASNTLNGLSFDPTGTRLCAWGGDRPWQWQNQQAGHSGEIRVWNIWRSKTATVVQGHMGQIRRVVVSNDNQHILSSSIDGTIRVWDVASGQLRREFTAHQHDAEDEHPLSPRTLEDYYRAVHVGVSSQKDIAVSTGGNSIRIWNFETGEVIRTIPIPESSCYGLAVRMDGKQFAFISSGLVFLYETSTGTQIANWPEAYVRNLAFDAAGKRLAVAIKYDYSGDLKVYDVTTRKLLVSAGARPERFPGVYSVAFTPDGERLVVGTDIPAVGVFNSHTGAPLMELAGHTAAIMSVAVSPDGKRFATAAYDNTVRLWDAESGQLVHTFRDHNQPVQHVAFSHDGKILVSGGDDGTVRIWKAGL